MIAPWTITASTRTVTVLGEDLYMFLPPSYSSDQSNNPSDEPKVLGDYYVFVSRVRRLQSDSIGLFEKSLYGALAIDICHNYLPIPGLGLAFHDDQVSVHDVVPCHAIA